MTHPVQTGKLLLDFTDGGAPILIKYLSYVTLYALPAPHAQQVNTYKLRAQLLQTQFVGLAQLESTQLLQEPLFALHAVQVSIQ